MYLVVTILLYKGIERRHIEVLTEGLGEIEYVSDSIPNRVLLFMASQHCG